MIPKELARKIRYIQIYTSKAVNDILAGEYVSVFKGQGMEFQEVREYQPGDDVRSIDWNVTARMGHPFVKRFVEERELCMMLLVDMSASGSFGSIEKTKNEVAAEISALLAFAAIKNNDKVGLIVFTDTIELFAPPAKGTSHVLRLIREILDFRPRKRNTNIAEGLDYLARVTRKRSVVFLLSDFQDEGYESPMRIVSKKHDLVAVSLSDPCEVSLPDIGLVSLEDSETGERSVIDTGNRTVRRRYELLASAHAARRRDMFRSLGIDHVEVDTHEDYVRTLVRFFRVRERRARSGR